MGLVDGFLLKVKRGETPFYARLNRLAKSLLRARMPLPGFVRPFYRFLYHLHFSIWYGMRWVLNFFYREPMFRSRCTHVGERLHLTLLPDITGHAEIYIGNNVNLYGKIGISSGRVFDRPRLVIEDGVDIGHLVVFSVNKEIIIEKGVHIASNSRIVDNDGHPRDPELRAADAPPPAEEVKPVRIEKYAWIGHGCYIMKGVTIGEGAIIGAASVVVTDIPAYSVAMGNPARVVVKDIRKQPAQAAGTAPVSQ
jgi:acetyltransferase-like isoleucine patch superfamily enzyme